MIDLEVNRRFWAKQFCSGFSFFHGLLFGTKRSTFLEPTWSAADLQQQQLLNPTLLETIRWWNGRWWMLPTFYHIQFTEKSIESLSVQRDMHPARVMKQHETPWHQSTRSPPLLHLVPSHKKKAIVREIHTTFIVDQCRHGFQQFRVGRQHGNLLMGTSI